jgi:hypothetical protein
MGATEKRRESGAGEALAADIGNLESVRLGGGGVYQEWDDEAQESEYRKPGLFNSARKCRMFPLSTRGLLPVREQFQVCNEI